LSIYSIDNTAIFVENSRLTKFYSRHLFGRKKIPDNLRLVEIHDLQKSVPFSFWLCLAYKIVSRLSDVNYVEKTPLLA